MVATDVASRGIGMIDRTPLPRSLPSRFSSPLTFFPTRLEVV